MNPSDLTRREQVLTYLRARTGLWIDGPDLANEQVGGSEGLKRLRELRAEGYNIQTRKHPDPYRDIFQYRIMPGKGTPERTEQVIPPAVERARQEELARKSPWPADTGTQTKIRDAIRKKEDGTFEYVPPQQPLVEQLTVHPETPPEAPTARFDSLPAHVEYGAVAVCPRCRSKTTRGRTPKELADTRKKQTASPLVDVDGVLLFRDPTSSKPKPCERCNGYGIIPNVGPIPMTLPDGAKP